MPESYTTPFGAKHPIPWRSYVWRVVIGHLLALIGWPVIAYLTTGNLLHEWPIGVAAATVPAVLALVYGYLRKTKPRPLEPELGEKLRQFGDLEREMNRKYQDFL